MTSVRLRAACTVLGSGKSSGSSGLSSGRCEKSWPPKRPDSRLRPTSGSVRSLRSRTSRCASVSLPAITGHFRLALADVQWLVVCYVLVYGSLMLVCGKLGDLFGHRRIFRIGLVLSALG